MKHRLCLLLACLLCGAPVRAAETRDKPNFVFILADDLGINDLGCYGRVDHATPALDRLAREGLRFTNAYAAQAICSPTRAAIMTGKAPPRLHLTTFLPGRPDAASQLLLHPKIELRLPLAEQTLAERLKAVGYATACVGKWHLGDQKGYQPTDQGFDVYHSGKANTTPSETEGGKGEYDLTAAAEKFIGEHRHEPFFLYLCHNCPHVPLAAQPTLVQRHAVAFNPIYAAMVETLDTSVGRIVDQIDRLGIGEQTMIIFTSDNGGLHVAELPETPATHNTPYRAGKGFCYEGGLRVPLIVRWTGRAPRNKLVTTPVISTDWTPTLVELAGAPPMSDSDGLSLAGMITRDAPLGPRILCWHMPHYTNQGGRPSGAVRDGKWKLIENYETGACEVYDLEIDPSETSDMSAEQPALVARLRGVLEKWRRDTGAQENTINPAFDLAAWVPLYQELDVSRLPAERKFSDAAPRMADWRAKMDAAVKKPPKDAATSAAEAPSESRPRGAILLRARDAKLHGDKLRYEFPPHKDTLGFWTSAADWVEWDFEAPRAGNYEVHLLQGCGKGSGGAEVKIAIGDQELTAKVVETGHFQRFVPRDVGMLRIDRPGPQTLSVRPISKPGPAVMDLRQITLIAVP